MTKLERYRRTPKGVLANIYAAQRRTGPGRGFGPVGYTLQQLQARFLNDPVFVHLYERWVSLGYPRDERPSIDRRDPLGGYTMENIQMLTWGQNRAKGGAEACLTKGRAVVQMSLDGQDVATFGSIKEAAVATGASRTSIPKVCDGCRRFGHSGGYRWRWA